MKRMYVTLSLMFIAGLWLLISIGQQFSADAEEPFDHSKRRMELREEMHKRMRQKLLLGIGPDQNLFEGMDQLFEEVMKDSFSSLDRFSGHSRNFTSEWLETQHGRTLILTPVQEGQQLDIDINAQMVTIKGRKEEKQGDSSFTSSFSNSFSVPSDVDGTKVKMSQKEGKIIIDFPFREIKEIKKPLQERRPLAPTGNEVTI
jgi:HSP20 family molecular chaperone IbpA